jgi:hypothetical protein
MADQPAKPWTAWSGAARRADLSLPGMFRQTAKMPDAPAGPLADSLI